MKLFASIFLGALAGVAGITSGCSSSDAANPAPDGGVVIPGGGDGGAPTIDLPGGHGFWTKPTNIEHYKIYASRDEAIAWFKGAQSRGEYGAIADQPVAASDPRYAAVDKAVADIWEGFKDALPADTQDLPVPIVILVESAKPGAYAVYDDALGLSPNVFMIQTPTLTLGDVALNGVIAHELTHHVLKHKWPGVASKIEVWYDSTKTLQHGFGYEQDNDKAIATVGTKAAIYGLATGDFAVTQWNGFTRPSTGSLDYYVQLLHNKAKATNAAACSDSDAARGALINFANPLLDLTTSSWAPTPDQLTQIDTLSKAYIAKETTCTSVVTGSFFSIVAADLGLASEADARKQASQPEIDANDAATSAYDAIVRLTKVYDAYLTSTDLKTVRYYSYEEQADDLSISILGDLAFDARGINTFLQQGVLDAAGRTECNTLSAAGEPPYGILSDPHHSTCWRIWHTARVASVVSVGFGG